MFKSILLSFALVFPLMSQASNNVSINDVKIAVEKASGAKCKIDSNEQEFISIYCKNSSGYRVYKINIENDIISGSGVALEEEGEEVACQVEGKIKADNKIKISIRCRV